MRVAAEDWLRKRLPRARIVHELVLERGKNRIDLAAVGETSLHLVEIKSVKDVLTRLDSQIRAACDVTPNVWVLVDESKVEAAKAARHDIESAWPYVVGLLIWRGGKIVMECEAGSVYRTYLPDPRAVARLMWCDELREIFGFDVRHSHEVMVGETVRWSGLEAIQRAACASIGRRVFPRADDPFAGELPHIALNVSGGLC